MTGPGGLKEAGTAVVSRGEGRVRAPCWGYFRRHKRKIISPPNVETQHTRARPRGQAGEAKDMLALLSSTANGFMLTSSVRAPVVQSRPTLLMVEVGPNVVSGTCKWFDSSKGFGFIAVDGEESDIFVHQSEIYAPGFRSLADGERVEFKVSADDRTGEQSHFWSPLDCSSHGRARRPRTGVRGTPCTHLSPPATASVGLTQRLLAHRQVEGCRGDGAGGGLRAGCAAPGLQRLRRQLLIIDLQVARALCADSTKWLRSSAFGPLAYLFLVLGTCQHCTCCASGGPALLHASSVSSQFMVAVVRSGARPRHPV